MPLPFSQPLTLIWPQPPPGLAGLWQGGLSIIASLAFDLQQPQSWSGAAGCNFGSGLSARESHQSLQHLKAPWSSVQCSGSSLWQLASCMPCVVSTPS